MDSALDFAVVQQDISAALVNTTRSASRISAEDAVFHRSSSTDVARLFDCHNAHLIALAGQLLRSAASTFRASLTDVESIDNHWDDIVDTVDTLLERSDICLDEYNGRFKNQMLGQQRDSPVPRNRSAKKPIPLRSQYIPKPQLLFDHSPSSHESPPFRPLVTSKPHAIVPLNDSLTTHENDHGAQQYLHPYASEIEEYQYPYFLYNDAEPIPYTSFENTQATFVDSFDGVLEMLEELKNATEIAIDLEHHDAHSYIGIVSLMQISTRGHDWIVDTLKPWRRKLEVLNQVFADPKILKVLHGAQMDIIWLQRDLGLYIVGLFDTYHASRVLGYAGGSLAFLLKKFVDFDAQKQYQMADWRMRPLPQEMFDYARSDTHFLLYVYDQMRNDLIHRSDFTTGEDCIQDVLDRSKETALQRYEYFVYEEEQGMGRGGWFNLLFKNTMSMSKAQFAVFRKVHQWRDNVAREEDENVNMIMPNHVLFNIARNLPDDTPTLLSVSHPISQSVRVRSIELLGLIRQSTAESVNGPEMEDKLNAILQSDPAFNRKSKTMVSQSTNIISQPDNPKQEALVIVADANMRSGASSFWGSTLATNVQHSDGIPTDQYTSNMVLSYPYFQQTDIVPPVLDTDDVATLMQAVPPLHVRHGALQRPLNGVVPLCGGKRNLDELMGNHLSSIEQQSSSSRTDTSMFKHGQTTPSPSDVALAEKRAAKQARKAARQVAREVANIDQMSIDGLANGNSIMQPFDYSSAPSILHATKSSNVVKGQKTHFNPYAKAADAASGMKKAQEFRSGKSWTFKH